jgi:membrane associated rhomboid family serine protease
LLTLVTSQFLHGGWMHLGANMLFLWVFGRAVEDRLGHPLYLLLYLVWGAGAALAQVWMAGPSLVPLIGASGAISGVLGAYFVLYPTAWVSLLVPVLFFFWVIDVPAILALAYWFLTQFLSGLGSISAATAGSGGVAWWAHIGGFVLGMLVATFFGGQRAPAGRSAGVRSVRPWGPAAPVVKVLSLAADAVILLLLVRAGLRVMGTLPGAEPGWLTRPVYEWSAPLIGPFRHLLPAVPIAAGMQVELYTVAAVLVYSAAASVLIWLLGLGVGTREAR